MGPREYQESSVLANALRRGDNNTLNTYMSHVMREPDAINIIRNANQMAGHGRENMYVAQDGRVVLQDNYTHRQWNMGAVRPAYEQPYGQPYYGQRPEYHQGPYHQYAQRPEYYQGQVPPQVQRPEYYQGQVPPQVQRTEYYQQGQYQQPVRPDYYQGQPAYVDRYGYENQPPPPPVYADRYGYENQPPPGYGDRYMQGPQYAPEYVDPRYAYGPRYGGDFNPAAMIGGLMGGLFGGFARPHFYGGYRPYAYEGYQPGYYHHYGWHRPNPAYGIIGGIMGMIAGATRPNYY